MKALIYHIILGIIQGITEFIPVSSSAHLVITQYLLGLKEPQIFFDILLHLGTLLAVIIYFYRDILDIIKSLVHPKEEGFRFFVLLIIGTIPTAILGFLLKEYFKKLFSSPIYSGIFLLVTGTILFLTRFAHKPRKLDIRAFSFIDAIIIGFSQVLAIAPGISRSGITISTGIFRGIDRRLCGRYSLLLSIPAIIGALISEIFDVKIEGLESLNYMFFGFITSFIIGYIAIKILIKVLESAKLHIFSYYCWFVGALIILFI